MEWHEILCERVVLISENRGKLIIPCHKPIRTVQLLASLILLLWNSLLKHFHWFGAERGFTCKMQNARCKVSVINDDNQISLLKNEVKILKDILDWLW
jgi:hypothetical protein